MDRRCGAGDHQSGVYSPEEMWRKMMVHVLPTDVFKKTQCMVRARCLPRGSVLLLGMSWASRFKGEARVWGWEFRVSGIGV